MRHDAVYCGILRRVASAAEKEAGLTRKKEADWHAEN